jgi:hypothetical protein
MMLLAAPGSFPTDVDHTWRRTFRDGDANHGLEATIQSPSGTEIAVLHRRAATSNSVVESARALLYANRVATNTKGECVLQEGDLDILQIALIITSGGAMMSVRLAD